MAVRFSKDMEEPEEDYWNTSKVKKNKINLFDDNVSVEAANALAVSHQLLASSSLDHDEDNDCINWDGTPAAEDTTPASKLANQFSSPVLHSNDPDPPSSGGFTKPAFQMTHTRSQSLTFVKNDARYQQHNSVSASASRTSLEQKKSPTIDDVVSPPPRLVQLGPRTPAQLEEEIQILRFSFEKAKLAGHVKLPPKETIKRIVHGEPYSLELYRSREDKIALLDAALEMHDGNAIMAIILFLKRTIKPSLFNIELQLRPVAVNHYLSYLRAHYDFKDLEDMLGMLGRIEEAAMLRYKMATSVSDPRSRLGGLNTCLKAHFSADSRLSHEASLIQEQISLLERQRPIEDDDAKAETTGIVPMFKQFPRAASILNMPVITTLYYCSFYHYGLGENSLASPLAIKNRHQLTEKQYTWTALSARSRAKQWRDVEELLKTKGWFGSTKIKAAIGFDRVCEVLHKTGAPKDVLNKYMRLVEDVDRRMDLAEQLKCHEVIIETLRDKGDKTRLEAYAQKLTPRSQEFFYAQDVLKGTTSVWKR